MAIAAALMGLVFVAFAVVQYNDPDGLLWAAGYLVPALLSVFVIRRKRIPIIIPLAALYLGWGIFTGSQISELSIEDEPMRETLGLGIVLVWYFVIYRFQNVPKAMVDK